MSNYIKKANLHIFDGIFSGEICFQPGLNIISGENGTLKTTLLRHFKNNTHQITFSNVNESPQIMSISPKRNSERKNSEALVRLIKQEDRKIHQRVTDKLNQGLNDTQFDSYSSLGELFILTYSERCQDGGSQIKHMNAVTKEFNSIICQIFPSYTLETKWSDQFGGPDIWINKHCNVAIRIENLSLGEQELLSLAMFLYISRERTDIYLIDEPEVHLNWHLEDQLFLYLNTICEQYNKQMIVVTHSRIIFKSQFLQKTQFLYWDEGKISWGHDLSTSLKKKLAGDAIEVISLGEFRNKTFFVEDQFHSFILNSLAEKYGVKISINECSNSQNVKSLYNYFKKNGEWSNSFFLIDGDNQGNPYPNDPSFIHLPVYCLQNYFLHPEEIAHAFNKETSEIQELLLDIIKKNKKKIFQNDKNKFFDFLFDQLTSKDLTYERLCSLDGSEILKHLPNKLSCRNEEEFITMYIDCLFEKKAFHTLFPENLLQIFSS